MQKHHYILPGINKYLTDELVSNEGINLIFYTTSLKNNISNLYSICTQCPGFISYPGSNLVKISNIIVKDVMSSDIIQSNKFDNQYFTFLNEYFLSNFYYTYTVKVNMVNNEVFDLFSPVKIQSIHFYNIFKELNPLNGNNSCLHHIQSQNLACMDYIWWQEYIVYLRFYLDQKHKPLFMDLNNITLYAEDIIIILNMF
jgi:hypothetical protein